MKKFVVGILLLMMGILVVGCGKKENVKVEVFNPALVGDVFQQNVKGNIVEGYQWKYEIKNNHLALSDEVVNFYDLESKTEVGDFFNFFNGVSEGDEEIVFKLVDTKNNNVYCEIKYNLKIDKDNIISLEKREVKDNRGDLLKDYTYDEPQVRFQGDEH